MRFLRVASLAALVCVLPVASARAQSVGLSINLGNERVVAAYNPTQHGDWHTAYKTWQPTTVYYNNGHYYDKQTKGSRAVSVYKKDDGYFLPPQDKKWVGADARFDYKHKPTSADYKRNP